MQMYGELLIFCSSFIILSLIILSINSNDANNVLAQPLPNSHDPSAIIDQQGQINEPQEIEPKIPARAPILIMIMTIIMPFLVRIGLDFYHSRSLQALDLYSIHRTS
jgi:hypothetical protein